MTVDTDILHAIRAECVIRMEFPQPAPPAVQAALNRRNAIRVRLAELAQYYLDKSERQERVDNDAV